MKVAESLNLKEFSRKPANTLQNRAENSRCIFESIDNV